MTAQPSDVAEVSGRLKKGGVVTWACAPGFPPAVIFPWR
jgi:peptide/nickel transport system substrate-binding protein